MLTIQQLEDGSYRIELTLTDGSGNVIFRFGGTFQRVDESDANPTGFSITLNITEKKQSKATVNKEWGEVERPLPAC